MTAAERFAALKARIKSKESEGKEKIKASIAESNKEWAEQQAKEREDIRLAQIEKRKQEALDKANAEDGTAGKKQKRRGGASSVVHMWYCDHRQVCYKRRASLRTPLLLVRKGKQGEWWMLLLQVVAISKSGSGYRQRRSASARLGDVVYLPRFGSRTLCLAPTAATRRSSARRSAESRSLQSIVANPNH